MYFESLRFELVAIGLEKGLCPLLADAVNARQTNV